ncbi:DUF6366 family protein [Planococcus sp. ISL-110]|uniref:DUF6366 family protein n=1 Tax=Planococcus sp. ISL-110 TaxID=2819167 RepID=UPI001BE76507|nr:DUF6366 family protein [Planococcus sp. ISL-110]MBT2571166.1 hypothetical protein [Planococcus sp. ISL-110]
MSKNNNPDEQRNRLSIEEKKRNPAGNVNDSINQTGSGMPNTSGMSLKEVGGIILLLVIILIGYIYVELKKPTFTHRFGRSGQGSRKKPGKGRLSPCFA